MGSAGSTTTGGPVRSRRATPRRFAAGLRSPSGRSWARAQVRQRVRDLSFSPIPDQGQLRREQDWPGPMITFYCDDSGKADHDDFVHAVAYIGFETQREQFSIRLA